MPRNLIRQLLHAHGSNKQPVMITARNIRAVCHPADTPSDAGSELDLASAEAAITDFEFPQTAVLRAGDGDATVGALAGGEVERVAACTGGLAGGEAGGAN